MILLGQSCSTDSKSVQWIFFCFENTHLLQKSYLSLPQKNRSVRRKCFLLTLLFSFVPYCLTVPLHFASLWGAAVLVAAFCYALDGDLVVVLMRGSPWLRSLFPALLIDAFHISMFPMKTEAWRNQEILCTNPGLKKDSSTPLMPTTTFSGILELGIPPSIAFTNAAIS